jgi:four helix bundle protein
MQFGHEQLDVYRVSVRYVAWAYETAKRLRGIDRHARDQLLRASQSIPLNIAEGNGKGTNADRRRFFEIARGSALECGSIQDCPEACKVLTAAENVQGKTMLIRIVSMLTKLGQRGHEVRENPGFYGTRLDYDYDNDNDNNDKDSYSDNSAKSFGHGLV